MTKVKMPKEARRQFKLVKDHIKQRDVNAARTELLQIELGPSFAPFHRLMAACAFIDKDYALSASHIEQALSLEPHKQVLISDAVRIYRAKKDDMRINQLLNSLDLNHAESAAELLRMALAYKSSGRYDDASLALEKGLMMSPENVKVRNQYGVVLVHLNRNPDALRQWLFSLKFDESNAQALACLGRLYLYEKDNLKAIDFFKRALSIDESVSSGRKLNLAEAYVRASSIIDARELLSSVEGLELSPRLHYLWGLLHLQVGDNYLSYSSFNRCIELCRDKQSTIINQIKWSSNFTDEDSMRLEIEQAKPSLDLLFDAFSMLKASEKLADQISDDTFNSDAY